MSKDGIFGNPAGSLPTHQQLIVLVVSTIVGFAASKVTENNLIDFFIQKKP